MVMQNCKEKTVIFAIFCVVPSVFGDFECIQLVFANYENWLRRGPTGPSSLAPATQDKMHPFYNNPMVMICATFNTLTLL